MLSTSNPMNRETTELEDLVVADNSCEGSQIVENDVLILPRRTERNTPRHLMIFSSIHRLLHSNDSPSVKEAVVIRAALASALTDKYLLEALLVERKDSVNGSWTISTKARIQYIAKFIRDHEGILSPLRHFPSEILQKVFEFYACPYKNVFDQLNINVSANHLPWELSHICRFWRTSALQLPSLWNYLPTITFPTSQIKQERQLAMLTELIRRSKNVPLNVNIYAPVCYIINPHPTLELLFIILQNGALLPFIVNSRPSLGYAESGIVYRLLQK